ncbi:MAG: DNA polymerase IV [Clostridiales bacterium]|nr:DNA polymerase IV [Clostridiales bacterium]
MERTILHIDLNNFFASVECKYRPELKDGYMAVCGSIEDRHGIVLAKNQKAKQMGVKTGMTIKEAEKICPDIVFVESHHDRYIEWSKKVKKLYTEYTDRIESFGIDEAWLDVTDSLKLFGSGKAIADEIRERVKQEFDLTVSVGVSFNKVFAKLGSDLKKPDGTTVITTVNYKKLVWNLPVDNLLFVGRATLAKLKRVGIKTIGELAKTDVDYIKDYLGKWGETLWVYANGKDESPVLKETESEEIKSVGNSITCYRDLTDEEDVKIMFSSLCETVAERVMKYNLGKASSIGISIRDGSLNWITRQAKLNRPSVLSEDFFDKAMELFKANYRWESTVRSLGVTVFDFKAEEQMSLSSQTEDYDKRLKLMKTVGNLREKYGNDVMKRAISYKDKRLTKEGEGHGSSLPTSHK